MLEPRGVDQGEVAKSSVQSFLFQNEPLSAFCHGHQKNHCDFYENTSALPLPGYGSLLMLFMKVLCNYTMKCLRRRLMEILHTVER